MLRYFYKGIIEIDQATAAIMTGQPDAKTTDYGKAITHVTFQTGSESLKSLETSLFVGSAHFVVENGSFFIETKLSRVKG